MYFMQEEEVGQHKYMDLKLLLFHREVQVGVVMEHRIKVMVALLLFLEMLLLVQSILEEEAAEEILTRQIF
jgi:hypothetical protein